jgi:hypothetical protein
VACGATEVCNAGSCVAPDGLAVLSVPLTAASQTHRFADLFVGSANLEGVTLTIRAYAPGATGGTLVIYPSDMLAGYSASPLETKLSSLSAKWMDLTIPVASSAGFDATIVKQVNLDVKGGPGPWINPTVVYIESIWSSNRLVNDTFDTSSGKLVSSSLVVVPGATIAWAQSVP